MRRVAQVGVLGAAAFAFMYFDFPLPPFPPFLKYDPGEVPALVATFALGPGYGVAVESVKALLISVFRSGTTGGPFGIFMNFLAGATLVAVAGWYYRVEHTKVGALKSLALGVAAMTGVMVAANILLTPIFYGIPRPQVIALVLPALLPFNLLKGTISSLITFFVYKRVRVFLYEWIADRAAW
ncbi:MAG: ECF transporter S component [Armatimonadota bacterium]|nr:ECF transporter S component [Armatimonadota bacterium]MDR7401786.1 ECF transporter S component [Armatimonadota bacterium]MDR7403088.1 ECF transporter S component [Armatimonadota bacterium]MDR7436209.1 ECF transporter S component [Armatimonadota bacterium]MDR7471410.1 ECF transporter S component [Armatimonadota bacterium]